jgi:K+-sensing histidine kinase KdpD
VIEDGGPGLTEYPEKSRALKRFTSQRSEEGGGSGLGLSIISSVIERHHGALRLSKSDLGGLRLEMKFPKSSE